MKNAKKGIGLKFAAKGILSFFSRERNAKIHLTLAIAAVLFGIYLDLSSGEWLWISLAIASVFITEMLNSSIELLCDIVSPDYNEKAGRLKDIAAGAVLIAAIFAAVTGCIVFYPHMQMILFHE